MSTILTEKELLFLRRMEISKKKHAESQNRYRNKLRRINPNYKTKHNEYMKYYQRGLRERYDEITHKLKKENEQEIKFYNLPPAEEKPKVDRRRRKQPKDDDVKPSYMNRESVLELTTIDTYIGKANKIHELFTGEGLSKELRGELKKLFNDRPFDESTILSEMTYINEEIEPTIQKLRTAYSNDNSFKSYINVLAVITSHIPDMYDTYQILTKLNIETNKKVEDKRDENTVEDENKIIDFSKREVFLENIDRLENVDDKLVYAMYTLIPPRRLDNMYLRLTMETDLEKLKGTDNYLILSTPKVLVYNNYKTDKTYGQVTISVPDDLDKVLNTYINLHELRQGDYVFHLKHDKRQIIKQGNFSTKITSVFKKVYGTAISLRFIRKSAVSNIENMNVKDRKQLALQMGHDTKQQLQYRVIKSAKSV